ncbi:NUDIX domain-containing protein [Streptomyces luteireticuli]|uniref:NUDIX domain-containing protein n=1 Tax=Streptomyces luteireticuli TaxID=173858 RepID=UPI0035564509
MTNAWVPPEECSARLQKVTMYGSLLFTDTAGRPLQLLSSVATGVWQFPGGNTDAGESPWETAVRECREETGLDFTGPPRLLAVHFMPSVGGWVACRAGFIFDGGALTDEQLASIRLDPDEHTEWQVRTVEDWERLCDPPTFRRLVAVMAARRGEGASYIETGEWT